MSSTSRSPNFIVILCDDLGYGDLGCYGSTANRTPRIDRMAAEGMRFTDFYMAQPLCSPSRAALLTGCYPKRVGLERGERFEVLFPGDAIGLATSEVTLPTLLKERGYATGIIGKWHLGDQREFLPLRHGFDTHFGLVYSNDMRMLTPEIIAAENLTSVQIERRKEFPPLPLLRDDRVAETEPDQASLTDRYTEEALAFVRANRSRPFFLYLAHMYVHLPLYAPQRFLEGSRNGAYGACVEHLDWCTGRLLDELAALGLERDTLVILTSDNGSNGRDGGSNAPLRGTKGSTWEGGMREPCIARWPARIAAGSTCRELATSMDLLPSLAALAGTSAPQDRIIDGRDIRPLLFGAQGARSPYEAFYYYSGPNLDAVRSGRYKLFLHQNLLYDLEADPGESNNLHGDLPQVAGDLRDLANRCRDDLGDARTARRGRNCRPAGRVAHPTMLTRRDREHPVVRVAYD